MFFADVETVIILRERADAVTAGVLSKEALFFSLFAPILTSISRS